MAGAGHRDHAAPRRGARPRSRRFTLGERLETSIFEVLLNLVEAAYTRDKTPRLRHANLELEKLRFLLRACRDLKLMNPRRHVFASKQVDEIGRMIGGWIRQQSTKR